MGTVQSSYASDVFLVDGVRTPFLKSKNTPGAYAASDLALQASRELLLRQSFSAKDLGEVILGCVMPSANEANIARVLAIRLGCDVATPAWTVQRNCASGMQALDSAAKEIADGRHQLVLAGGTEAMSQAPLLWNENMTKWFARMASSKTIMQKLKTLTDFRPSFLRPIIALLRGLNDPLVNLSMGQTAENIAYRFNITRAQMDQFALMSHERAARAQDEQYFREVGTVYSNAGSYVSADDGIRRDTSLAKLGTLAPFFDKIFGEVTAGNSSQISDGASITLLAGKDAVTRYGLPIMARLVDVEWAGVDPKEMGLGPVHAVHRLLKRQKLNLGDIDYWEINEAFAAQVLGCLQAFDSAEYCRNFLGEDRALGAIDPERLNIDGGAIALGHPVGASGCRLVLHLAHILKRTRSRFGIATLCIGGGQGGAMLIENVSEGLA